MLAIQKILASAGIGAAAIFLRVEEESLYPDDDARVTLKLKGGDVAQEIRLLTLSFVRVRISGSNTASTVLDTQTLAASSTIEADAVQTYDWTFRLLDMHHDGTHYLIKAEADIAFAINPHDQIRVNVKLHREFHAVAAAMRRLGFYEINSLRSNSDNVVHALYRPPEFLRTQLQTAELRLSIGTNVTGKLVLSYVGQTMGEQVKSFLGVNAQQIPLEFERGELVDAEKNIRAEGAIPILRQALADSLILPDNEAHWMLRASQSPTTGKEELLRPASDSGSSRPAALLRPVENKDNE